MRFLLYTLLFGHLQSLVKCQPPTVASLSLPPLKERRLLQLPHVQNFWGSVGLRHDMISLGTMALTPFNGNFQNCSSLLIDGSAVELQQHSLQWYEGQRTGMSALGASVLNRVRMPFEQHGVLQSWSFNASQGVRHTLSTYLDGPIFYQCDNRKFDPHSPSCGWGTSFPVDRTTFIYTLNSTSLSGVPAMVTVHKGSATASASAFWWRAGRANLSTTLASNSTFFLSGDFVGGGEPELRQAIFVGTSAVSALAGLEVLLGDENFDAAFSNAGEQWEERWAEAFLVPTADGGHGTHFAGSLPTLTSNLPAVDRLYYWATLALLSLERTNYLSAARAYVISQGPSNSFNGEAGMGGSGQFTWDLSFASVTYSLLDPPFVKTLLEYIVAGTDAAAPPSSDDCSLLVPQCWDAYPPYGAESGLYRGAYRFDFYSAYMFFHQFCSVTNSSSWLLNTAFPSVRGPLTGLQYLEMIARSWERFPTADALSPWLADYGSDKRDYLEVVPTYTSVVPALQFASVGMLQAQARLYEAVGSGGSGSSPAQLRSNATSIFAASLAHLWRAEDNGVWRCAYGNGSTSAAVRSVTDYVYIPQALSLLGREMSALPVDVAAAMQSFFTTELFPTSGAAWVRALSLSDPLCRNVMNTTGFVEDLLVMRADWGCMGSYGGIPGFAMESAAGLLPTDTGAAVTAAALLQLSPVAAVSSPGQGIAVDTPPWLAEHWNGASRDPANVPIPPYTVSWPEFFDESDFPPVWPDTERYIQNAEGSISDAIIRTLFGYRPDWLTPYAEKGTPAANAAIDAALWHPQASRGGFTGTLGNLRTPLGYINITAGAGGLTWVWA
jgi:hypothetical protein